MTTAAHPQWLAQKIASSRRAATPRPCPKCDTPTLVGPDHDTCAMTARVDATPVDPIREVIGLLEHRSSYDLIRGCLYFRETEHIHTAYRPHPVHLTHRCTETRLF